MQITNDQLRRASAAGVELLSSDTVQVPSARMGDLILLREVLGAVATGQLIVARPPEGEAELEAEAPKAAKSAGRKGRRKS